MMAAPSPNIVFDAQNIIRQYLSIGMNEADIQAILISDGYSQDIIQTALRQLQASAAAAEPAPLRPPRVSAERLSDVCARIQSLFDLMISKAEIKAMVLEGGVIEDEFELAWSSQFSSRNKWEGRITLAEGGINQYNAGKPAACTMVACRFTASLEEMTPERLARLIVTESYNGDTFLETDSCIRACGGVRIIENPWEEQREYCFTMQVSFDPNNANHLRRAVPTLLNYESLHGALITGNGITLGFRKVGNSVEIVDTHGDDGITKAGNTAYVIRFRRDEVKEIVDFLVTRLPDIGFNGQGLGGIEIWPLARVDDRAVT